MFKEEGTVPRGMAAKKQTEDSGSSGQRSWHVQTGVSDTKALEDGKWEALERTHSE